MLIIKVNVHNQLNMSNRAPICIHVNKDGLCHSSFIQFSTISSN